MFTVDQFESRSKTVFKDYLLAKYPALRGGDSASLISSIESVKLTYDHRCTALDCSVKEVSLTELSFRILSL